VDQEQLPSKQTAGWERSFGDRVLSILRMDPDKWTMADRRLALLGTVVGLTIVIIAICGYAFGWEWTGFPKRTLWDWLKLLIIPAVIAMGTIWFNQRQEARQHNSRGSWRT
jgi:hypothetical protein